MPTEPTGFVAVDIIPSIDRVVAFIERLPPEIQDQVADEVAKLLVNIFQTEQATYRYVSRKDAYGVSFFSEAQRRKVMAMLRSGEIRVPYHRTQAMRRGWKQIGSGVKSIVANETPGVEYVMGDNEQSRHEAAVGWKTVGVVIKEHNQRIDRVANATAQKVIDKAKL